MEKKIFQKRYMFYVKKKKNADFTCSVSSVS